MSKDRKSVRQYYQESRNVASYDSVRFGNGGGRIVDAVEKSVILEMFEDFPKEEFLLEVAAGTGRFALMFARGGFRVVALDSSIEMLKSIRQAAQEEQVEVLCVQGDAFKLPFKKGAFKGIYSIRFAWHFASYKNLIDEIMKVCSGCFVFDLMNKKSLSCITTPIANRLVYRSLHTTLTTSEKMRNFFQAKGYSIVETTSRFVFPFIFYRKLPLIANWVRRADQWLLKVLSEGTVRYYKIEGLLE